MSNEKVQYYDSKVLNPKMLNFIIFDHRCLVIKQYIDSKIFDILEELFDNTLYTMKNIDLENQAQPQFIINLEEDNLLAKYNYFYILSNLTPEFLDFLTTSKSRYILILNGNERLLEHSIFQNPNKFIQANIKLGDFPQIDIVNDTIFEESLIKMMDPARSENCKNEIKSVLSEFYNKMFDLCNYIQNSELTLARDKLKDIQDFLKNAACMQESLDLIKIKAFLANYYSIPRDLLDLQFDKIISSNFKMSDVQGFSNIYQSIYKRQDCFGIGFKQTIEFFSKAAPEMDPETFIVKMYLHDNEKMSAKFTGAFFLNTLAENFKDKNPTKEELLEFISKFKDVADEIIFDMQLIPEYVERYRIEKKISDLPPTLPEAHSNNEEIKKYSEEFDTIIQDDEDMKKALITTLANLDSSENMRQSPKQMYIWLRKTKFKQELPYSFQSSLLKNYFTNYKKRFPKNSDEYMIKNHVKTRFESVFSNIPRAPFKIHIVNTNKNSNLTQDRNQANFKDNLISQQNFKSKDEFYMALEEINKVHKSRQIADLSDYIKNIKIIKQYIRSFL